MYDQHTKPHYHRRTIFSSLVAHRFFSYENAHTTHSFTCTYFVQYFYWIEYCTFATSFSIFFPRSNTDTQLSLYILHTVARLVFTNCPCGKCHCWYLFIFFSSSLFSGHKCDWIRRGSNDVKQYENGISMQ